MYASRGKAFWSNGVIDIFLKDVRTLQQRTLNIPKTLTNNICIATLHTILNHPLIIMACISPIDMSMMSTSGEEAEPEGDGSKTCFGFTYTWRTSCYACVKNNNMSVATSGGLDLTSTS